MSYVEGEIDLPGECPDHGTKKLEVFKRQDGPYQIVQQRCVFNVHECNCDLCDEATDCGLAVAWVVHGPPGPMASDDRSFPGVDKLIRQGLLPAREAWLPLPGFAVLVLGSNVINV